MLSNFNTARSRVNNLFVQNLPKVIKCTNDKKYQFAKYRKKQNALKHEQICVNAENSISFIAVDIDKPTYPYDISPPPNIVTYNAQDARAHALYILDTPVHLNDHSSTRAQKYAIATYNGLVDHLGADPAYNQSFTKNPLSPTYRSYALHDRVWELKDFEEYFAPKSKKAANDSKLIGWSRNCHVFEKGRQWAYIAIRRHLDAGFNGFMQIVLEKCQEFNSVFQIPLDDKEIRHTAKSIAKWVWNNRFELTSYTKQSARGIKSGIKRKQQAMLNKKKALELLGEGLKAKQIALELNLSERQIWSYISLES